MQRRWRPTSKNGRVLVPAGSVMRGVVNSVTPAGAAIDRKGSMTLPLRSLHHRGSTYSIRARSPGACRGRTKREYEGPASRDIGVFFGGFKGALASILIGGGALSLPPKERRGSAARHVLRRPYGFAAGAWAVETQKAHTESTEPRVDLRPRPLGEK